MITAQVEYAEYLKELMAGIITSIRMRCLHPHRENDDSNSLIRQGLIVHSRGKGYLM